MFDWLLSPLSACLRWFFQPLNENQTPAPAPEIKSPFLTFPNAPHTDLPVGMEPYCGNASASEERLTPSPVNPPSTPNPIAQYLADLTQLPFEKRISGSGKPDQYVSAPYSKEELTQITKRFPGLIFSVVQSRDDFLQYRLAIRENRIPESIRHGSLRPSIT